MKNVNRREFIGTGAVGLLAVTTGIGCAEGQETEPAASAVVGTPFDKKIGFQSYGMRKQIGEDFQGTLRDVKALGFDYVEMCSPRGGHYRQVGFGGLTDLPPADVKQQIEDTGLVCKAAHFQADEVLVSDPAETADYAAALGLTDLIMSGSGVPDSGTLDQFKAWAEQCNKVAEIVQAAGLRLGYHMHRIGPEMEGKPQYEHIMDLLDPNLVKMQFQFAAIADGYDIEYYLDKYAGRYTSLHLHDWDPALKGGRPGRLGGIVPVGEGMIDWAPVFRAAMKSPIDDHGYCIEIETEEPLEGLRRSIDFLKTLHI
jgi:sugar phosphate isomerase/epimerase